MDFVKTREQQEKFWNNKAKTFPRYEEKEDNYEAGMLNRAREHGVVFKDADILDVGCGSGMYTIRLGKDAKHVTATDISSEMLRILKEDASAQGINNIDTFLGDWLEFKPDKKYDVVFCSMTPAVQSEEGRAKVMEHAGGWVVYMGFADRTEMNMTAGLYRHYGITPKKFHDAPGMRAYLEERGIKYTTSLVSGEWAVPRTYEEAAASCRDMLSLYNIEPDEEILAENIKPAMDETGKYIERTAYSIEMIVWHV
ncbi:class I SAM-dependent methyltransferase [Geovibrio thiophilus]|uniref:Class I SAM-dependent methyltransferase n=1 Tax=Geovibrio thiophilus TaxID=139438 RepID=A0A410JVV7_9BACT|nr:class I SAM-dependent methyltransferase [Geovibrio thiophilus]QAR32161.1 class I SAM-dependent methyltransferase [Geovibrio thiophilus]